MKKINIGNRIYNAVTLQEYYQNPELYNPKFTAIIHSRENPVLPLRGKNDKGPGVYNQNNDMVALIQQPESNIDEYSYDKIIDFDNAKDIQAIIENNKIIKDIESEILINSDNILKLSIGDNDTPEMRALKSAINAKRIDAKNYEDSLPQYQNDMRLLRGTSITLGKLISLCDAFDINASLTLEDKEDAASPMNHSITINLNRD